VSFVDEVARIVSNVEQPPLEVRFRSLKGVIKSPPQDLTSGWQTFISVRREDSVSTGLQVVLLRLTLQLKISRPRLS
jgi:hypothetical protein